MHGKHVTIGGLLKAGLVREGDQWRLSLKGEVVWGRIRSNGQLEVNDECHDSPSRAFSTVTSKSGNGWDYWHYQIRTPAMQAGLTTRRLTFRDIFLATTIPLWSRIEVFLLTGARNPVFSAPVPLPAAA